VHTIIGDYGSSYMFRQVNIIIIIRVLLLMSGRLRVRKLHLLVMFS